MGTSRAVLVTAIAVLFWSLGCSKGGANFGVLDQNSIPQPLLGINNQTTETIAAASPTETFSIEGTCDSKIHQIVATAVGISSAQSALSSFAVSAVTVDCGGTGKFSFMLKSLSALGFSARTGQTYDVQLRGITDGGVSNPSVIYIVFSTANGPDPKHLLITSGSTLSNMNAGPRMATSANFKAEIRVSNKVVSGRTDNSATSPNYILKTGVAAQAQ